MKAMIAKRNNFERNRKPSGSSVIEHKIRYALDISIEEYVVADLIYAQNKKRPPRPATYMDYFVLIGLEKDDVDRVVKSLREKELIKDGRTTEKWNKHFNDEAEFDALWKIHPKGNKQEAREKFLKTVKIVSFLELEQKLKDYVESKKEVKYRKDLSGWLNPRYKRWEDAIVKEEQEPEENSKTDFTFNHNLLNDSDNK